jgi:hypothetical protein
MADATLFITYTHLACKRNQKKTKKTKNQNQKPKTSAISEAAQWRLSLGGGNGGDRGAPTPAAELLDCDGLLDWEAVAGVLIDAGAGNVTAQARQLALAAASVLCRPQACAGEALRVAASWSGRSGRLVGCSERPVARLARALVHCCVLERALADIFIHV